MFATTKIGSSSKYPTIFSKKQGVLSEFQRDLLFVAAIFNVDTEGV